MTPDDISHLKYQHRIFRPLEKGSVTSVYSSDISYLSSNEVGELHFPNSSSSFLQRVPDGRVFNDQFHVLAEKNLKLAGFRSFFTADGQFFNDESMLRNFDYQKLRAKLNSHLSEDLSADFGEKFINIRFGPDIRKIEGPIFALCSDEPSNYGSWIYRVIPKLMDIHRAGLKRIFVINNSPWMKQLVELMSPQLEIIRHTPRASYILDEAFIPTLRNEKVYFDRETRDFYAEAARRVGGDRGPERVYLRRGAGRRSVVNEAELEMVLAGMGFAILPLAEMPLIEQIRNVRDARVIVCPGGSGLFNLVFANRPDLVVDIEPGRSWVYAHQGLMRSLGHRHVVTFGHREKDSDPHSRWYVDIDAVRQALS